MPVVSYNLRMCLVVFLRGVNVGGHRTFRPSVLAKELAAYDVVSVGAAGTFVVRRPGSQAHFRAVLLRKLPFEAQIVICDGRDLISLATANPFATHPVRPDEVRFVSILCKAGRVRAPMPIALPISGDWLLRIVGSKDRFVFGVYRRHVRTIGYLGQIDKLVGAPATTRNWNTIAVIVRVLRDQEKIGRENKKLPPRGSKLPARELSARIRS
ncbi:MAG: DUF1697 domain-containing protein [Candidatus Acidiferrales bacterium]